MATKSILSGCVLSLCILATPGMAQRSLFDEPLKSELQPGSATPSAPAGARGSPAASAAPAATATEAGAPATGPAGAARATSKRRQGPRPTRLLTIENAGPGTVTSIEVSEGGKSARLEEAIAPNGSGKLKLPAFRACAATVTATFAGVSEPSSAEVDICKDKTLRFSS